MSNMRGNATAEPDASAVGKHWYDEAGPGYDPANDPDTWTDEEYQAVLDAQQEMVDTLWAIFHPDQSRGGEQTDEQSNAGTAG